MVEPLVETLDLDIDESNELLFKVGIEGHVQGPAKVRLVCEGEDVAYIFPGRPTGEGVVQFVLHRASGIKEGIYPSQLEVLVENKYFVPVVFNINLKKAVKVVAEAVSLSKVIKHADVVVTAAPIAAAKPKVAAPVIIEGPQTVVVKPAAEQPSATLAGRYKQRRRN